MRVYLLGTTVSLRCAFRFSGRTADPDTVRLVLESPDRKSPRGRRQTFLVYGQHAQLKRLAPGRYEVELVPERPGIYAYRWESEPGPAEVRQFRFKITESDE